MSERKATLYAFIWSCAVGAIWFGPAWFGYVLHFADQDAGLYYYPVFTFFANALQSGISFLWMPGILSGFPIYLSQSAGFFDPLNIAIFSLFDGIQGTQVRIMLDFIATCFLSYVTARSFGISRLAAALVGPSYLIAFHMRILSNPLLANTLFLVPLLVYAVNALVDNLHARWKTILMLGVGLGLALLGGYTQVIVYALLAAGLYLLLRLWFARQLFSNSSFKVLAAFGVGVVVGVCIGLPYILPVLKFLPLSARAEAPTYEQATLKVVEFGDFVLFAVPDYFYIPYVTAGRKPLYVGALWSLFALGAIAYAVTRLRRRSAEIGDARLTSIAIVALLFFLLALQYSPLYYVVSKIPVLGQFRFPFRFMYVGAFFIALLGAIGFDRIGEFLKERFVRFALGVGVSLYSALGMLILIANIMNESVGEWCASLLHRIAAIAGVYELLGMSKGNEHYAEAFERGIAAFRELLTFSDIGILIPTTVLFASIGLMGAYVRGTLDEQRRKRFAIALVLITVLMIPFIRYRYYVPMSAAGTMEHVAIPHATDEDKSLYRMYSFLPSAAVVEVLPPGYKPSFAESVALRDFGVYAGLPNYSLYAGLNSVDGYDQFETNDMLAAIKSIGGLLHAGYGAGSDAERIDRLLQNLDVLAMMGGKYIISGVALEHPRLTLISDNKYTNYEMRLRVYKVANVRPRYYIASNTVAMPHSGYQELAAVDSISFGEVTYLDCKSCRLKGVGSLKPLVAENGLYKFEIEMEQSGYMVLSESLVPGWKAWVDDIPSTIIRANGLYMAIEILEGNHVVTFEFQGLLGELRYLKAVGLVNTR